MNKKEETSIMNKKLIGEFESAYVRLKKNGYSYANYSFSLSVFIIRLYNSLISDNTRKVFFLSREGEFLKELFDCYCEIIKHNYSIKTEYVYVSRQSTFPATLSSELDNECFLRLFKNYPNMSIAAFLKNIGFLKKDINEIETLVTFNLNKIIKGFQNSDEFKYLKKLPIFRKKYIETVLRSKSMLVDYLSQLNFFESEKVGIVDVGWKGSIQDNIYLSIDCKKIIKGYYIGLVGDVATDKQNQKKGLLFADYPINSKYYDIWCYDSHFFERFLSASHPSTKGYCRNKDRGEIIPLFNEFVGEKKNYSIIRPIQLLCKEQFIVITKKYSELSIGIEEFEKVALYYHIKMLTGVNSSNMRLQKVMKEGQEENFGLQQSNKEHLNNSFSAINILRQIKKIKMIRNSVLVMALLNSKRLFGLSVIISRFQKPKMLRKIKNV